MDRFYLVKLFLIVTTLALFWPVTNHDFVDYDDQAYVTENRQTQAGLTLEGARWAFTTFHTGNWHPLTWLSHMLDAQLYGLNPKGHHFTSLLLHTSNTLLLFLILHRMTGALWRSASVAALFAIHPLHVESVAWVAERKDLLSGLFFMLTLWAYVGYCQHRGKLRYLGVIFFYALGLMSKPMLVTLPFVLLLLDYWPLCRLRSGEERWKEAGKWPPKRKRGKQAKLQIRWNILWEKLPLFALTVASSAITYLAQKEGGAVASLSLLSFWVRVENALVSYFEYIFKMLWPWRLAVLYPHPGDALPGWQVAGAFFLILLISVLVIKSGQRRPYLLTGWLWYLGTLVPVIGIVQVGIQAMADRYTYLPLIGLFISIVWGISDLNIGKGRLKAALLTIAAGVIGLVLTISTWFQISYWRDSLTLFQHAAGVTFNNYEAHTNAGVALTKKGNLDEAIAHFSEALRIKSNSHEAHTNLGVALGQKGRLEEAVSHFSEALKIKPDFAKAHNQLAIMLEKQGKLEEAIAHYSELIKINPDHENAHYNLGFALARQGRTEEAIPHFLEALRITPRDPLKHNNLGVAYLKLGRYDDAIREYQTALEINPQFSDAMKNLEIARRLKNEAKTTQPQ